MIHMLEQTISNDQVNRPARDRLALAAFNSPSI